MTPPTKIDTSSLLTILGVIAAVWALITPNARLRLRFCLAWWDWVIVGFAFLLSNYLVFAPALKSLDLYFSFGPWKWGLDSSSAVYLISLAVAIYILFRLKNPKLSIGRTGIFLELVENLHLTKRYDDLAQLLAPQLEKLISIIDRPVKNRLCDKIANNLRISNRETAAEYAHEVLLSIVSSPELTNHFALAHPSLCLELIKIEPIVRSDFTSNFISALLSSPNSRLYVELKNNLNVSRGHRLLIPKNNRILHFFFSNAKFAADSAIYRDIGDYLYWRLDEDEKIIAALNKSLGSYYDVSKYKCPIYSGVTLFEIMVHEGIHQGLQDHLWLHYYSYFARKIIKNMNRQSDEYSGEWETPFHFLLCHLFSIATDWAEQCEWIDEKEIPQENKETDNFDLHYISKEATKLLGAMLQLVMPNKKLTLKSRKCILDIVISCYIRLKRNKKSKDVAESLLIFTTRGEGNSAPPHYRRELLEIFNSLDDYRLRTDAPEFRAAIESAIQAKARPN
ncbi:hypothetical protein [Escherichia coli]|uniref:hypothetical protein n=1 Tax=Escherichia coli TaxID=562 RepID=UPI0023F9B185|nr:hypothetical protein [Escherichia coli]MDF7534564.1 hypothetical protein [Escherichia coli]